MERLRIITESAISPNFTIILSHKIHLQVTVYVPHILSIIILFIRFVGDLCNIANNVMWKTQDLVTFA